MTWDFSLRAKIEARFDQARTKDLLPESIDGDSRRQRILGRDQPLGQIQPIQT